MQRLFYAVLIFATCCGLYCQTIRYDFAYDDVLQITLNPLVTTADPPLRAIVEIFRRPTPPGDLYRPFTSVTYFLNYYYSGLVPFTFHVVNVLLYAAVTVLGFYVVLPLVPSVQLAGLALLLFAVHPIHVEAVANIVGRAELLAAFFGFGALLLFRQERYLLSAISLLLATLSKESALTFLPLAPLYGLLCRPQTAMRPLVRASVWLLAACLLYLLLRGFALHEKFVIHKDPRLIWVENPLLHFSFGGRLLPALKIFGDYIFTLIAPLALSADYSFRPHELLAETFSFIGLLTILIFLIVCFAVWITRRHKWSFFGLWFIVTFALTTNIFTPIGTIRADRLAFTPSLGFIAFFTCLLHHAFSDQIRSRFGLWFGSSMIVLFALFSALRIPVWENNDVLFAQSLRDNPRSPKVYYNYGLRLYLHHNDLEGAEQYFRKSLELYPNYLLPMRVLADIALRRKKYGELEYWYRRILAIDPRDTAARQRLEKLVSFGEQLKAGDQETTTKLSPLNQSNE